MARPQEALDLLATCDTLGQLGCEKTIWVRQTGPDEEGQWNSWPGAAARTGGQAGPLCTLVEFGTAPKKHTNE